MWQAGVDGIVTFNIFPTSPEPRFTDIGSPETLAGIGVSLRIVFAVVLGGMYSLLGPTVGAALTIALSEYLRIVFGLQFIGMAETIYGLLLMLFIIFLPQGILGSIMGAFRRPVGKAAA